MRPPERILILLPALEAGGAERQSLQVARGFARMGAEVLVLADAALLPALAPLAQGVTLRPAAIAFDSTLDAGTMHARQARALAPLLPALKPDAALVCLPLVNEALGAMQALRQARIPTLAMAHLVTRSTVLAQAEREALRAPGAGWAAVSTATAHRLEALLRLPTGDVAAVPNGLARLPAGPRPGRSGPPILLSVGRLDERKGAHLAPGIAAAMAAWPGGGRLRLAGQGPLAAMLAASPGMELLGQRSDIATLLAEADAFLLASEHEGCPLSLLEAAQAGCPILATSQALEAWPEAAGMARHVLRHPGHIASIFAESLADAEGTAARVARAREAAAAWDEDAMIRRTAFLLAMEAMR